MMRNLCKIKRINFNSLEKNVFVSEIVNKMHSFKEELLKTTYAELKLETVLIFVLQPRSILVRKI